MKLKLNQKMKNKKISKKISNLIIYKLKMNNKKSKSKNIILKINKICYN